MEGHNKFSKVFVLELPKYDKIIHLYDNNKCISKEMTTHKSTKDLKTIILIIRFLINIYY